MTRTPSHIDPQDPRLRDAHAVVIGLGGLGCPALRVLAGRVGRITIWDHDLVERSNLPRQVLYDARDVGRPKVEVAAAWIERTFPWATVHPVGRRFHLPDAPSLAGASVVLDGTDSIADKFAVSDAAVAADVPLVHAGATGLRGQITTILPGVTACYRCVFETPPLDDAPACSDAGVLSPFVTLVGILQGMEALRIASGASPTLAGRLLTLDAGPSTSRTIPIHRRPDCPACADGAAATPMRNRP